MLFNFDPLEFLESAATAFRNARERRRLRREALLSFRTSLLREVITQLDLPFGSQDGTRSVEAATQVEQRKKSIALCADMVRWTDDDITRLCDAMVQTALESLRDAKTDDTRREVLCWMAPAANAKAPFSFEFCCRVGGFEPDAIRHFVGRNYRDLIKKFVGQEQSEERENANQLAMAI
ncbi:hypothetical protein B1806_02645 [Metallibacterium scheffleri]|uniref:Uncharacterized protein n=1 Tax=Metallibacterium scheffleri TaxID=993689 RepID=A0A4V3UTR5_9GAMM|nr:hypothetical protein B1806_02645 [Metallibacterium scheffleri]